MISRGCSSKFPWVFSNGMVQLVLVVAPLILKCGPRFPRLPNGVSVPKWIHLMSEAQKLLTNVVISKSLINHN